MRAHCDARTEVIDARGAALVPGLVDSHMHPFWGAELARGVDLSRVRDRRTRCSRRWPRERPQRGWLFAWGLDYDAAPTPAEIARGGRRRRGVRAAVRPAHRAGHAARARAGAGRPGRVDFPDGSEVVCDETACRPASCTSRARRSWSCAPRRALRWPELRARHVAQLRRLNALGLTGAHVMDGEPETFELLRDLEGTDELTMRLRVPLWVTPDTSDEEMEAWLRAARRARGAVARRRREVLRRRRDRRRHGVAGGSRTPTARGSRRSGPTRSGWRAAMSASPRAGFQLATHTIGDAAVRFTLDAYIARGAAAGVRHRLEHLETLPGRPRAGDRPLPA